MQCEGVSENTFLCLLCKAFLKPHVKFAQFQPCIVQFEVMQIQVPGKDCYDDQNLEQISGACYFLSPLSKASMKSRDVGKLSERI